MKNLEKYSPYVLALLRIVSAYMFILHGTAKFWEFPISMTGGNGAVGDPLMIVGGVIEIVGSILLIWVYLFVLRHLSFQVKWLMRISLCTLQVKGIYFSQSRTVVNLLYFTLSCSSILCLRVLAHFL